MLSVLGYCHFKTLNFEAAVQTYGVLSEQIAPEVPEYAFYLAQSLYQTQ